MTCAFIHSISRLEKVLVESEKMFQQKEKGNADEKAADDVNIFIHKKF